LKQTVSTLKKRKHIGFAVIVGILWTILRLRKSARCVLTRNHISNLSKIITEQSEARFSRQRGSY